ncbi:hypothetical protein BOTNAR_0160g00140 [Botryotinia narcissicola]|uniref:Uncharacterized protein n=1 Tax=Botryotinia narcissicola TaxID=278944 RepID=A0A4Z1IDL8_9HELO|nr:hypothetical protein BOTNAR_0160g00140 [Botryotinia narcissicola]
MTVMALLKEAVDNTIQLLFFQTIFIREDKNAQHCKYAMTILEIPQAEKIILSNQPAYHPVVSPVEVTWMHVAVDAEAKLKI